MSPAEAESVISRASDQSVWPWQAEPYRLWSLLDMLRFYAERWISVSQILQHMPAAHMLVAQRGGDVPGLLERIQRLRSNLTALLDDEAKRFPFSGAVAGQIARFTERLKQADLQSDEDIRVLQALGGEITLNVMAELEAQLFVMVDPKRRSFFENGAQFGDVVEIKFPESTKDISAAARCYALEEWTACVFHLMRVLEHGLRAMATRFDVSFKVDSWHAVLHGIEEGITKLRDKKGLTDDDRNDITMYSEAAIQFRHFKDAWRNHVSHSRAHYDERDADVVLAHVKEFMQHVATIV